LRAICGDLETGYHTNTVMHFMIVIEQVWSRSWRLIWRVFMDDIEGHDFSKVYISSDAIQTPLRDTGEYHQCPAIIPDTSRPPWSEEKYSRIQPVHFQMLLKATAVMEVHSGCYNI
jgi:hypothetical protein